MHIHIYLFKMCLIVKLYSAVFFNALEQCALYSVERALVRHSNTYVRDLVLLLITCATLGNYPYQLSFNFLICQVKGLDKVFSKVLSCSNFQDSLTHGTL